MTSIQEFRFTIDNSFFPPSLMSDCLFIPERFPQCWCPQGISEKGTGIGMVVRCHGVLRIEPYKSSKCSWPLKHLSLQPLIKTKILSKVAWGMFTALYHKQPYISCLIVVSCIYLYKAHWFISDRVLQCSSLAWNSEIHLLLPLPFLKCWIKDMCHHAWLNPFWLW